MIDSKFLTPLDGRWIDDDNYMLLADLVYRSEELGGILRIPSGFVTDFASVPRLPIVFMLFGDRAHHESVPHDFIYQKHEVEIQRFIDGLKIKILVSRKKADDTFLEAMEVRHKPAWMRYSMYSGVRVCGMKPYRTGLERFKVLSIKPN